MLRTIYILLPNNMAARTGGIDRNVEIIRHCQLIYDTLLTLHISTTMVSWTAVSCAELVSTSSLRWLIVARISSPHSSSFLSPSYFPSSTRAQQFSLFRFEIQRRTENILHVGVSGRVS